MPPRIVQKLLIAVMLFATLIRPGLSSGDGHDSPLREEYMPGTVVTAEPDGAVDDPRAIIGRIMALDEFRNVKRPQPTWFETARRKIAEFSSSLLEGIYGASAFPLISELLIWILAAVAFAALAIWILRELKLSARLESGRLDGNSLAERVSELPWREWIARAREASAKGNWREAVHLTYWGGISFLESNGLWPPDRARTPREYLRMLPASSEHRETLQALTQKFEITWYGGAPAGPESFSESLECLERMGCRFN